MSLGCPRNLYDSELILANVVAKGYKIVEVQKADIAIVNTCAFIKEATQESIDSILELIELKKEGRLKKIVVAGCLVERYKYDLVKELPEVDCFLGRQALKRRGSVFLTPSHYSYLKITEGCLNRCSFCVIPKIKGDFSSLPIEDIIEEIASLEKRGLRELNIIGQDTSGWGKDLYKKRTLPLLLREISQRINNIHWVRLLYLYPHPVVLEVARIMRNEPKFCRYIDLPLQHINDRLLKLMRRNTTKKEILNLIEKIRKILPQVALRTSLIVGFPSETDKEFKELLDFVAEVKFERLGVFMYSREEGTPAYNFKGQIPYKAKMARFDAIMLKQQEIARQINSGFIGKEVEVLIEEKENDFYLGRTEFDAPEVDGQVYVKSNFPLKIGDFTKVRIQDSLEYDLIGETLLP